MLRTESFCTYINALGERQMYELNKVGEHTYYIDSPTNVGLYEYDGRCCLIDGGSDKSAAKKVLKHIEEQGWTLEKVFCTHGHADHTGGCAILRERTGCIVYAPKACAAVLNNPQILPSVLYGGFPSDELRSKFLMAPQCECLPLVEEALPNGLSFTKIDGHDFEQAAFRTSDNVWFIADGTVSEQTTEKYKIAFLYDVAEHLKSLEKLKTLEGRLFIPSHDVPQSDISNLVDRNIACIHEVANVIKRFCENGITIDDLLEKIFAEFGIKLYLMQYALIGSTTRSYLSWLVGKGEMECVFEGSRLLWRTVK